MPPFSVSVSRDSLYESSHGEEFYQQSAELNEYDRNVTMPELMKRLPEGEVQTCQDLD
jgi:hypothetical protein